MRFAERKCAARTSSTSSKSFFSSFQIERVGCCWLETPSRTRTPGLAQCARGRRARTPAERSLPRPASHRPRRNRGSLRSHESAAAQHGRRQGDDRGRRRGPARLRARGAAAGRAPAPGAAGCHRLLHRARRPLPRHAVHRGRNLANRCKRTGRQPRDDVERWGVEVLRALVYLHGHHPPIVHRDIKPANIALTPRGDIVLLDFGLAKGRPGQQTRTEIDEPSIYGFTPGYAPPEQLAASGTDARSDLYSLAATLYHLACGAPPPGAHERMTAVHAGRPDLLAIESTLPARLGAVLLRALALDPAARFQSAQEMLDALQQGADDQPRPMKDPPANRARRLDAAAPARPRSDAKLICWCRCASRIHRDWVSRIGRHVQAGQSNRGQRRSTSAIPSSR